MAKFLFRVTGQEVKATCGKDQLVGGVEAGIEGGIHAMCVIWEEHSPEEDREFLIIDVRNAFNEENRTSMIWSIRNEWPSRAQFTFSCYLRVHPGGKRQGGRVRSLLE